MFQLNFMLALIVAIVLADFLAVQDSSIGDNVSQSLRQTIDFSVFRALQ